MSAQKQFESDKQNILGLNDYVLTAPMPNMETERGRPALDKVQNILVETLHKVNAVYQEM